MRARAYDPLSHAAVHRAPEGNRGWQDVHTARCRARRFRKSAGRCPRRNRAAKGTKADADSWLRSRRRTCARRTARPRPRGPRPAPLLQEVLATPRALARRDPPRLPDSRAQPRAAHADPSRTPGRALGRPPVWCRQTVLPTARADRVALAPGSWHARQLFHHLQSDHDRLLEQRLHTRAYEWD